MKDRAAELGQFGAEIIYVADSDTLAVYSTEAYCQAAVQIVETCQPTLILLSATAMGKDLGPYLSAKLDAPLSTDVIAIGGGEALEIIRPMYASKAFATEIFPAAKTVILSLRPNVFPAEENPCTPQVETLSVTPVNVRARVKEVAAAAGGKKDLTEAEVIVSGGRGMKDPVHFKLIEELATALGASVGASRAVVDAGWRPHSEQVGQTGKVVPPVLCTGCGLSWAGELRAGMSSCKVSGGINKCPAGPIFKIATYGIIGDALEILPALTEEVKKLKK